VSLQAKYSVLPRGIQQTDETKEDTFDLETSEVGLE
jgi:hypothetical protein